MTHTARECVACTTPWPPRLIVTSISRQAETAYILMLSRALLSSQHNTSQARRLLNRLWSDGTASAPRALDPSNSLMAALERASPASTDTPARSSDVEPAQPEA